MEDEQQKPEKQDKKIVRYGDILYITCTLDQSFADRKTKGCISGNGFVDKKLKINFDTIEITDNSTTQFQFMILNKLISNEDKLYENMDIFDVLGADPFKQKELFQNISNQQLFSNERFEKTKGTPVLYGHNIILKHIYSNRFVTLDLNSFNIEAGIFDVFLTTAISSDSSFKIVPSSRINNIGQLVFYQDSIYLISANEPNIFFSNNLSEDNQFYLNGGSKEFEIRFNKIKDFDFEEDLLSICLGDYFKIYVEEQKLFLATSTEEQPKENIEIKFRGGNLQNTKDFQIELEKNIDTQFVYRNLFFEKTENSQCYWEIKSIFPQQQGPINNKTNFILRNISNGLYLALNNDERLELQSIQGALNKKFTLKRQQNSENQNFLYSEIFKIKLDEKTLNIDSYQPESLKQKFLDNIDSNQLNNPMFMKKDSQALESENRKTIHDLIKASHLNKNLTQTNESLPKLLLKRKSIKINEFPASITIENKGKAMHIRLTRICNQTPAVLIISDFKKYFNTFYNYILNFGLINHQDIYYIDYFACLTNMKILNRKVDELQTTLVRLYEFICSSSLIFSDNNKRKDISINLIMENILLIAETGLHEKLLEIIKLINMRMYRSSLKLMENENETYKINNDDFTRYKNLFNLINSQQANKEYPQLVGKEHFEQIIFYLLKMLIFLAERSENIQKYLIQNSELFINFIFYFEKEFISLMEILSKSKIFCKERVSMNVQLLKLILVNDDFNLSVANILKYKKIIVNLVKSFQKQGQQESLNAVISNIVNISNTFVIKNQNYQIVAYLKMNEVDYEKLTKSYPDFTEMNLPHSEKAFYILDLIELRKENSSLQQFICNYLEIIASLLRVENSQEQMTKVLDQETILNGIEAKIQPEIKNSFYKTACCLYFFRPNQIKISKFVSSEIKLISNNQIKNFNRDTIPLNWMNKEQCDLFKLRSASVSLFYEFCNCAREILNTNSKRIADFQYFYNISKFIRKLSEYGFFDLEQIGKMCSITSQFSKINSKSEWNQMKRRSLIGSLILESGKKGIGEDCRMLWVGVFKNIMTELYQILEIANYYRIFYQINLTVFNFLTNSDTVDDLNKVFEIIEFKEHTFNIMKSKSTKAQLQRNSHHSKFSRENQLIDVGSSIDIQYFEVIEQLLLEKQVIIDFTKCKFKVENIKLFLNGMQNLERHENQIENFFTSYFSQKKNLLQTIKEIQFIFISPHEVNNLFENTFLKQFEIDLIWITEYISVNKISEDEIYIQRIKQLLNSFEIIIVQLEEQKTQLLNFSRIQRLFIHKNIFDLTLNLIIKDGGYNFKKELYNYIFNFLLLICHNNKQACIKITQYQSFSSFVRQGYQVGKLLAISLSQIENTEQIEFIISQLLTDFVNNLSAMKIINILQAKIDASLDFQEQNFSEKIVYLINILETLFLITKQIRTSERSKIQKQIFLFLVLNESLCRTVTFQNLEFILRLIQGLQNNIEYIQGKETTNQISKTLLTNILSSNRSKYFVKDFCHLISTLYQLSAQCLFECSQTILIFKSLVSQDNFLRIFELKTLPFILKLEILRVFSSVYFLKSTNEIQNDAKILDDNYFSIVFLIDVLKIINGDELKNFVQYVSACLTDSKAELQEEIYIKASATFNLNFKQKEENNPRLLESKSEFWYYFCGEKFGIKKGLMFWFYELTNFYLENTTRFVCEESELFILNTLIEEKVQSLRIIANCLILFLEGQYSQDLEELTFIVHLTIRQLQKIGDSIKKLSESEINSKNFTINSIQSLERINLQKNKVELFFENISEEIIRFIFNKKKSQSTIYIEILSQETDKVEEKFYLFLQYINYEILDVKWEDIQNFISSNRQMQLKNEGDQLIILIYFFLELDKEISLKTDFVLKSQILRDILNKFEQNKEHFFDILDRNFQFGEYYNKIQKYYNCSDLSKEMGSFQKHFQTIITVKQENTQMLINKEILNYFFLKNGTQLKPITKYISICLQTSLSIILASNEKEQGFSDLFDGINIKIISEFILQYYLYSKDLNDQNLALNLACQLLSSNLNGKDAYHYFIFKKEYSVIFLKKLKQQIKQFIRNISISLENGESKSEQKDIFQNIEALCMIFQLIRKLCISNPIFKIYLSEQYSDEFNFNFLKISIKSFIKISKCFCQDPKNKVDKIFYQPEYQQLLSVLQKSILTFIRGPCLQNIIYCLNDKQFMKFIKDSIDCQLTDFEFSRFQIIFYIYSTNFISELSVNQNAKPIITSFLKNGIQNLVWIHKNIGENNLKKFISQSFCSKDKKCNFFHCQEFLIPIFKKRLLSSGFKIFLILENRIDRQHTLKAINTLYSSKRQLHNRNENETKSTIKEFEQLCQRVDLIDDQELQQFQFLYPFASDQLCTKIESELSQNNTNASRDLKLQILFQNIQTQAKSIKEERNKLKFKFQSFLDTHQINIVRSLIILIFLILILLILFLNSPSINQSDFLSIYITILQTDTLKYPYIIASIIAFILSASNFIAVFVRDKKENNQLQSDQYENEKQVSFFKKIVRLDNLGNIFLILLVFISHLMPFVWSIMIFELIRKYFDVFQLIETITTNYIKILKLFGIGILLIYMYSVIALTFFSNQFDSV